MLLGVMLRAPRVTRINVFTPILLLYSYICAIDSDCESNG